MGAVWDELNAKPIKAPPSWVRSGDPVERCPRIGRTRRLHGAPPCTICGNRSEWHCDCDEGGDA